jgi:hypothetical protein
MKNSFVWTLALMLSVVTFSQAQSLTDLKAMKEEKEAARTEAQATADGLTGEINNIQKQIDILSGWRTGLTGLIGFDFTKSNNWQSSPNPESRSSALNLSLTAFAKKDSENAFIHNKALLTKAWSDVDLTEAEQDLDDNGLFDNGTVDILNLSSLAGHKLSDIFALSGTLTPGDDLVIVVHPLTYHLAFPSEAAKAAGMDIETKGALGAKIRADYTKAFNINSKQLSWSSTFTTFIPYGDKKQTFFRDPVNMTDPYEAGLFEYTWLNTLSFEVWKGIGVGIGFGLRNAELESEDVQSYYSLGLSYNL